MHPVQTSIIPVVSELIRSNPRTISLARDVAYYGPPLEAGLTGFTCLFFLFAREQ